MLNNGIAAVAYFVDNLQEAETLYKKVLKIDPAHSTNNLVVFNLGTTELILHPKDTKSGDMAVSQVAYWAVDSIEDTKKFLLDVGFVIYRDNIKSESKNETVCQLKDPIGNVIGLLQKV
jgi:extradiol dioxygenase family protein